MTINQVIDMLDEFKAAVKDTYVSTTGIGERRRFDATNLKKLRDQLETIINTMEGK